MSNQPDIIVVGTGAIGSFYGGKLSQSGASVSTLSRSDFDTVKENGIQVKSVSGDFTFIPDEVCKNISHYTKNPDYIIVTTKVLPEIDIPSIIRDKVMPDTSIVLLQNGIDIESPLVEAFPDNEIISALAFICVSRKSPGIVEHEDFGRITIGRFPGGSSEKVTRLQELFSDAGVVCKIDENINLSRWKKLLWNAPFNPISVIGGGINTKVMTESKHILNLSKNVMKEIQILADKSGCNIPDDVIERNIEDTKKMTPYKTSMLLDYENGRNMEVEAILGNTLRIAEKYNISVPYTSSLYALLSILNEQNRVK